MADRRATSSELYAMSKHLAVKCAQQEVAYLKCKDKFNHPEDCLQEAKAVMRCSEHL
jgi:NADH dehydrogenase (ubiquinone) 1 alpha subcomplex subunit 8